MANNSSVWNGSTWKKFVGIKAWNGSSWKPTSAGYVWTGTVWTKFWPTLGPYTTTSPKIRLHTYSSTSSSGTQPPTDVFDYIQMGPGGTRGQAVTIGDGEADPTYLWGWDGVWANNTGATITRSFYYNSSNDFSTAFSISGGDTLANTSAAVGLRDKKYLWYYIKEVTSSGTGEDQSPSLYIIKQKPIAPSTGNFYFSSPSTAEVNTPITLNYTLDTTWYRAPDVSGNITYIEWFAESSTTSPLLNATTRVSLYTPSTTSGTTTFTPSSNEVGKYIFAKITIGNSYTEYLGAAYSATQQTNTTSAVSVNIIQKSGVRRTIYTGRTLGTSQTVYVGTNGYIGYDAGSTTYSGTSNLPTGTFLNLFGVQDLQQNGSTLYQATATGFSLYWAGYKYGDVAQTVQYYITFYWNSDQVDVYFSNNSLASNINTSDAAIITNGSIVKTWSANSTSLASYTLPTLGNLIDVTNGTTDDGYTVINLSKPIAVPTISTAPTISRSSQDSYVYNVTDGSWTGSPTSYRYQWYYRDTTTGAQYSYFIISGATSNSYDASSYKLKQITCVVWATNAGGESNTGYGLYTSQGYSIGSSAGGASSSNEPMVYYKAPVISLSASSSTYATLTYNYSYSNDDSGATITGQYKLSSSSTWTTFTLGNQNTNNNITLTAGTYDIRIVGNNSATNGNSYQTIQSVTGIVVQATPLPQYFSINSATKAYPSGGNRNVVVSWSQSTNANKYEVQIEGSNNNSSFTVLQSFAASPYTYEPTRSYTYNAVSYTYYRVAVRASNSNSDYAYNDSGSSSSLAYYYVTGTNPTAPSITSISAGTTSASVYWIAGNGGSNLYSGVQTSVDNINWSSTQSSSPASITGLSASSNYTAYVRSINADGLVSSPATSTFSTSAALTAPSGGSVSVSPTSGTAGSTTFTATTSGWSGNPSPTYTYSWQYLNTSFSWVQISTGSTFSPGATFNAVYPNYGVQVVVTASNSQGSATASSSFTLNSPQYTVTYNGNGGSTPSATTVNAGVSVTLPTPTYSGFSFNGWYTASSGGTLIGNGGATYTPTASITLYAQWTSVFVTPQWNGTMPKWSTVAPSNFQRITTGTANFKWGWANGTFSFSGSVGTSKGWNFNISTSALSAGTARTVTNFYGYTTTNDSYTTVNAVSYPYIISSLRGDVTYSSSARYGSIQPYQFGTDGNEYDGTWTAGI